MFICCNFDTTLQSLVPGQPAKYPPVCAGDHMLARVGGANAPTQSSKQEK